MSVLHFNAFITKLSTILIGLFESSRSEEAEKFSGRLPFAEMSICVRIFRIPIIWPVIQPCRVRISKANLHWQCSLGWYVCASTASRTYRRYYPQPRFPFCRPYTYAVESSALSSLPLNNQRWFNWIIHLNYFHFMQFSMRRGIKVKAVKSWTLMHRPHTHVFSLTPHPLDVGISVKPKNDCRLSSIPSTLNCVAAVLHEKLHEYIKITISHRWEGKDKLFHMKILKIAISPSPFVYSKVRLIPSSLFLKSTCLKHEK